MQSTECDDLDGQRTVNFTGRGRAAASPGCRNDKIDAPRIDTGKTVTNPCAATLKDQSMVLLKVLSERTRVQQEPVVVTTLREATSLTEDELESA